MNHFLCFHYSELKCSVMFRTYLKRSVLFISNVSILTTPRHKKEELGNKSASTDKDHEGSKTEKPLRKVVGNVKKDTTKKEKISDGLGKDISVKSVEENVSSQEVQILLEKTITQISLL